VETLPVEHQRAQHVAHGPQGEESRDSKHGHERCDDLILLLRRINEERVKKNSRKSNKT
jgi:hypothetical protein